MHMYMHVFLLRHSGVGGVGESSLSHHQSQCGKGEACSLRSTILSPYVEKADEHVNSSDTCLTDPMLSSFSWGSGGAGGYTVLMSHAQDAYGWNSLQ